MDRCRHHIRPETDHARGKATPQCASSITGSDSDSHKDGIGQETTRSSDCPARDVPTLTVFTMDGKSACCLMQLIPRTSTPRTSTQSFGRIEPGHTSKKAIP